MANADSGVVTGVGSSLPMLHSITDGWFWLVRMLDVRTAWALATQAGWSRYWDATW